MGGKSLPAWVLKRTTTSNASPDSDIRIVLDTNVLISAAFGRSAYVEEIINLVLSSQVGLIISPFIQQELYRKLVERFEYPKEQAEEFVAIVRRISTSVSDEATIQAKLIDTDDLHVIATAVNGKAQLIVTKDRALLRLRKYDTIGIVDPSTLRHIFPRFFT